MTSPNEDPLPNAVQRSWRTFLDTYEPLRPELYRFCRHLTRSPWDAEDMAQETLARAFVALATMSELPRVPRSWLFRVASNLWLNRTRPRRELPAAFGADADDPATSGQPRATREAAGTLITQLSPQERAALVLKDVFGLSLDEVAEVLATTPGAVKAALHRGRGKLASPPESEAEATVAPAVLDAFCAAFNARDLDRLTALLLDTATLEYPGFKVERGAAAVRAGTLRGTLFGCPESGYVVTEPPRSQVVAHRGEFVLLWWWGSEVHAIVRVDVTDDRIARLCSYYHAPEVLTEVCAELDVPCRTHGYRPSSTGVAS